MTSSLSIDRRFTIEDQMIATKRHSTGFDYLRLILSILIIFFHTFIICYGRQTETLLWTGPLRSLWYFLVPGFFGMSGFLVASSLMRVNNLVEFITLRGLRILPALCGEVFISAFLIGTFLTEAPLQEYFFNLTFFQYLLNAVGDIHYFLPGLFVHSAMGPLVNAQLWTIPYELECYGIITIIGFVGLARYPRMLCLAVFLYTLFVHTIDWYSGRFVMEYRPPEHMTVSCCLWGIFIYIYRHKIPYNLYLLSGCVVVTWLALMYADTVYIASFPIAYITIYLGLMNPKKVFPVAYGDYSYGLYLYGFPIQQAVYQVFPKYHIWYIHFPLSLFFASICAYVSWTYLEAKALGKKKVMLAKIDALCLRIKNSISTSSGMPIIDNRAQHTTKTI